MGEAALSICVRSYAVAAGGASLLVDSFTGELVRHRDRDGASRMIDLPPPCERHPALLSQPRARP